MQEWELSMVAVTSPKSGLVGAGSLSTKRTLGDVLTHSILEITVWSEDFDRVERMPK